MKYILNKDTNIILCFPLPNSYVVINDWVEHHGAFNVVFHGCM